MTTISNIYYSLLQAPAATRAATHAKLKKYILGSVRLCFAAICILMDIAPERTDGGAKKTVRDIF